MMGLSDRERILMTRSAVLIQYTRVMDGQTDGIGVAYMRYSIYAVARKNQTGTFISIYISIVSSPSRVRGEAQAKNGFYAHMRSEKSHLEHLFQYELVRSRRSRKSNSSTFKDLQTQIQELSRRQGPARALCSVHCYKITSNRHRVERSRNI